MNCNECGNYNYATLLHEIYYLEQSEGDTFLILSDPIPNHGASGYGDLSLFTRTFPRLSWIRSIIQ